MTHYTCEVCGVSIPQLTELEPFDVYIALCEGCVKSGDNRGSEIVAAITEVLRS